MEWRSGKYDELQSLNWGTFALRKKNEMQKAKMKWPKEGDANSSFFLKILSFRRPQNFYQGLRGRTVLW